MPLSKQNIGLIRRTMIATSVVLYLYFLLPATAVLFYELHHLTGIDAVYWGYSIFKIAGYYFGIWEYQLLSCLLIVAVIIFLPLLVQQLRRPRRSV